METWTGTGSRPSGSGSRASAGHLSWSPAFPGNGAGKTTTIRVLCGLLRPTCGHVVVDGICFVDGHENEIKQRVGYMSQRFTLYDDLSILENFDFAAALRDLPHDVYIKNRDRLLNFIGFKQNMKTVVHDLPGGIKQEVALCVALLHDPKIIFLDEPTAGVSSKSRARFWKLIRQLAANGKTVFVTTHYMDEAENCDRIALMRAGQIIAMDSPKKLKEETFSSPMFALAPRHAKAKLPSPDDLDVCEPYGSRWHIVFRQGINAKSELKKYARDFDIIPVTPSLEDVFIKLVEGQNR